MKDLNFGSRLWLAFTLPFRVLFDGALATRVAGLDHSLALPLPPISDVLPSSAVLPISDAPSDSKMQSKLSAIESEVDLSAALHILAILQREGRFIDFLQEDMSGFGDDEIGAAARVVQEGCKRALGEYIKLTAIRTEAEGAAVELQPGYDASQIRLTGKLTGQAPYRGILAHHGWLAESIRLPKLSAEHDARVLAPAEVEI